MDTSTVATVGRRRRRRYSLEFKASVIRACQSPGVSIAAIALANGLNANMLRKWVIDAEDPTVADDSERGPIVARGGAQFIALTPPQANAEPPRVRDQIRIEVQRGTTAIKVSWPSEVASECGVWLRELLR